MTEAVQPLKEPLKFLFLIDTGKGDVYDEVVGTSFEIQNDLLVIYDIFGSEKIVLAVFKEWRNFMREIHDEKDLL